MKSVPCESSGYEQANDQWIRVVHCSNKKKKMPTVTSMKTDQSSIYSNRFSPLTNLNENQAYDISPTSDYERSSSLNSTETITIQSSAGSKITTIINGQVMKFKTKKHSWTVKNSLGVPSNKINKYEQKVKIIGDSHLKASVARTNQFLNTKFEVCSFIKPGASANQLVHSQETKFMCLGRKDVLVINGGMNDSDKNSNKRSGNLVMMTQFMQKNNNTNIIVVNIPPRHDLAKNSKTNLAI